jgi:hypothetical protein
MPRIKINIADVTNPTYGQQVIVFVPGTVATVADADDNGCKLLSSGEEVTKAFGKSDSDDAKYVNAIISSGLSVLYCNPGKFNKAVLMDKNNYDIKFFTTGVYSSFKVSKIAEPVEPKKGAQAINYTIAVNSNVADMLDICSQRRDCTLVCDCSMDAGVTVNDVKKAFNGEATFDLDGTALKFAGLFINKVYASDPVTVTNMADLQFIKNYGNQYIAGRQWEAVSGVNRGLATIPENLCVSKYDIDENVQGQAGTSFNGICNVRPYGPTIWGDRTMFRQSGTGTVASSYFSIMNMVTDIAKTCYNTSIRYTFESNNDLTWTGYKAEICRLLDQIVAANKIASYSMTKVYPAERAKIRCKIHIVPIEPVEDFDINIVLSDAAGAEVGEIE